MLLRHCIHVLRSVMEDLRAKFNYLFGGLSASDAQHQQEDQKRRPRIAAEVALSDVGADSRGFMESKKELRQYDCQFKKLIVPLWEQFAGLPEASDSRDLD
ncbi:unnamed protein product [Prorocentrum cordatum]|uniref:Uncharacterized protein n=1 Tax=Prorocentrum cordatum TaxID=2364126 RepID=A0ABN9RW27_9DINO|nr:unnamed protein product [Polarella glacialis]